MRKIIFILIFSMLINFVKAQQRVEIQMDNTAIEATTKSLKLKSCVKLCNAAPVQKLWTSAGGNAVLFTNATGDSTIISGFQTGIAKVAFTVIDNFGKRYADTLTVTVHPPVVVPCPVCTPVNSTTCAIFCPKQRTVVGVTYDGTKYTLKYDNGTTTTLPKTISIQ